ncbi:CLAVATA3/ESR (CLE)-related protein 6 [Tanacetum coccineum]
MASFISSKGLLLMFIIYFVFCITSNANHVVRDGDSKQLLLRKLGLKMSDFEYYEKKALGMNPRRVAPGGPDDQHHSVNPGRVASGVQDGQHHSSKSSSMQ